MKNIFALALALFIFSACTKEDDRELISDADLLIPFATFPDHCYNNILDEDETEIDCGGSCDACLEAAPTCSLSSNTGIVNGTTRLITNVSSTQLPGGTIGVTFRVGSMPCEVNFKPEYTKSEPFQIINGWSISEQEMNLELSNPVYNYLVQSTYTSGGLGFINSSDNGQYELYICGSTYANNYPISLRVLVP